MKLGEEQKRSRGFANRTSSPIVRRDRKQKPLQASVVADVPSVDTNETPLPIGKLTVGGLCLALGLWAYWPTLLELIATWDREPDYSHGFLVVPLALVFLWQRRARFPGLNDSGPRLGMALLGISLTMRFLASRYFMGFLDGWSIVPWVAAVVVLIGGRPLLAWCLPSIGFLVFMVPLPFRVESELSAPLQRVATKLSTLALQLLGQPAFSEGNVILLGENRLEVARACSGLRLFVSTLALAYVYLSIICRPLTDKLALCFAAIPIAIVANAARIVATGLLCEWTAGSWSKQAIHDWAGWMMILLAAALFWLLLVYLGKLFREEEQVDITSIVRQARM